MEELKYDGQRIILGMSRAYLVRNGPTAGRVEPVAAQSDEY